MSCVAQVSQVILQIVVTLILAVLAGVTLAANGVGAAEIAGADELVRTGVDWVGQ